MNGIRLKLFGYVFEMRLVQWCASGYYSAPPGLKVWRIELFRWEAQ